MQRSNSSKYAYRRKGVSLLTRTYGSYNCVKDCIIFKTATPRLVFPAGKWHVDICWSRALIRHFQKGGYYRLPTESFTESCLSSEDTSLDPFFYPFLMPFYSFLLHVLPGDIISYFQLLWHLYPSSWKISLEELFCRRWYFDEKNNTAKETSKIERTCALLILELWRKKYCT